MTHRPARKCTRTRCSCMLYTLCMSMCPSVVDGWLRQICMQGLRPRMPETSYATQAFSTPSDMRSQTGWQPCIKQQVCRASCASSPIAVIKLWHVCNSHLLKRLPKPGFPRCTEIILVLGSEMVEGIQNNDGNQGWNHCICHPGWTAGR